MDLQGIEKMVAEAKLRDSERLFIFQAEFNEQALRLKRLANANYDSPLVQWAINVAQLTDTPIGTGIVSAQVMNMRTETDGSLLYVTYFFTGPDYNMGSSSRIGSEKFTDIYRSNLGRQHNVFSTYRGNDLRDFIMPQLGPMDATASMLEAALYDESLNNREVLQRYESQLVA